MEPGMTRLRFWGSQSQALHFPHTSTCFYPLCLPGSLRKDWVPAVWMIPMLPASQQLAHPKLLPSLRKVTAVDVLTWELFQEGERIYSTPTHLPYEFTNSNGLELPWGTRDSSEQEAQLPTVLLAYAPLQIRGLCRLAAHRP